MNSSLSAYLAEGKTLIADGATGTMLMAAGLDPGTPPEAWNIEFPDRITTLHQSYLTAGSQIILTNTFGGSRIKLAKRNVGERAYEFNLAAARIARETAAGRAYVAGDIGPTGELMQPLGTLTYEDALAAFTEQAQALGEGGVDAIWVETMSDLNEARAAIKAAHNATDLPVFCSLSFGKRSRTMMGISPKQAAEQLWPLGLAAIGLNCGEGLGMVAEVLRQYREALPGATLIAKPNAGLPKLVQGETVYDVEPADFAAQMLGFIGEGAQIVGGCCGSGPAFISALKALL
jgi:5-methyltetrahydrofolate--homocysteine methyltransferase